MITEKIFLAAAFLSFFFMVFGFQAYSKHKIFFEKAKFIVETKGDLGGKKLRMTLSIHGISFMFMKEDIGSSGDENLLHFFTFIVDTVNN